MDETIGKPPTTAVATGTASSARALPHAPPLAECEADLLPVGYFHGVSTLPTEVAEIALHNKTAIYDLLFHATSEAMLTTPPIHDTSVHASTSPPCFTPGDRR